MEQLKLVTARELADRLGLSVETIWRYTRDRQIPYIEVGKRQYRYDPAAVMRSMEQKSESSLSGKCAEEREAKVESERVYTYADYLQLPEDDGYQYEVLDGMLVREPSPTPHHQRVSRRLQRALEDYFWERDPAGEVFDAPIDVTLSDTCVLQPDLAYVPGGSEIVEERRLNGAPLLAVEIVSPSSASRDRVTKQRIYARAGVKHYWIVDPQAETIEAFAWDEGRYVVRSTAAGSETFTHPDFPGLEIDLQKLWSRPRRNGLV